MDVTCKQEWFSIDLASYKRELVDSEVRMSMRRLQKRGIHCIFSITLEVA